MAQTILSVPMDKDLKQRFDEICENYGLALTTVVNVFAHAVVSKGEVLPEIFSLPKEITREGASHAFAVLRAQAEKNGSQGMSLEEINEEIRLARLEMDKEKE